MQAELPELHRCQKLRYELKGPLAQELIAHFTTEQSNI